MDLSEAIKGRRSVRGYKTGVVDEKAIRDLIEAAVLAPNAMNQQPWIFTIVPATPRNTCCRHLAKVPNPNTFAPCSGIRNFTSFIMLPRSSDLRQGAGLLDR